MPASRSDSRAPQSWPIDAAVLLAIQAVSLVLLQVTSAPVLVQTQTIRYMPPLLYLRFLSELPWRTIDLVLAAVVLVTFLSIIVLELVTGRLTQLLRRLLSGDRIAVVFTFLISLVVARYYFAPGRLTWGADASHHAVHTWIASEALTTGTLPVWTPLLSVGSYFVQYYGFTFAYLSGAMTVLFGDLDLGLKVTLGLIHALSGVTVWLYVRTLTGSRSAAFVSALAYVAAFWHAQLVTTMGRFSAGLVFALLPLPFYALECLRRRRRSRLHTLVGAASIAALAFTHPGYTFWTVGFLLLGIAVLAGSRRTRPPLMELSVMLGLGLALSAWLLIPMWVEQEWTGLGLGFSMATQGKPSWGHLLFWSNYRSRLTGIPDGNHWFGGYIGISLVLLVAAAGIVRIHRRRYHPARDFPAVGLILSLILTFGYEWPVLRDLDVVQAMGAARYLVFSVFFLSVLAGPAVNVILAWCGRRRQVLTAIVTVILVDLGSTTFIQVHHFASDEQATSLNHDLLNTLKGPQTSIPVNRFVPERNLHVSKPINSFLITKTRTPSAFGLFEEHPRADREFVRPFLETVRGEMGRDRSAVAAYLDSERGAVAVDGLRLLNTRHYIQAAGGVPTAHVDLETVSPVVVSSRLTASPLPIEGRTFELVEQMGLDDATETCRTILSRDGRSIELGRTPTVRLLRHDLEVDRATITFETDAESFCRLSYGYYPGLVVERNGNPVEFFPTADGFIGLHLPAGTHTLSLSGTQSSLRKTIFWIDVILAAAAVYWARQCRFNETDQEVG